MKTGSAFLSLISTGCLIFAVACSDWNAAQDVTDDPGVTVIDIVYDHGQPDTGWDARPDEGQVDDGISDNGYDAVMDTLEDIHVSVDATDVLEDAVADQGTDEAVNDIPPEDTGRDVIEDVFLDYGIDAMAPLLVLDPDVTELHFAQVLPGCSSTSLTLRLLNDGGTPLEITSIGFDVGVASITMTGVPAEMPVSILPGGEDSIDLEFQFAPTAGGEYEAVVCVYGTGFEETPVCVHLYGVAGDCGPGTHLCGCQCADDSSVATCGTRCTPCTTTISGAVTSCELSGETYVCASECADGFHQCGSSCKTDSDPNACGPTCELCYSQAHSTRICRDDTCSFDCLGGWGDCDGKYATGCEEALNTTMHCGQCDNQCTTAPQHGVATCEDGECSFDCLSGYHEDGTKCSVNNIDTCCGDDGVGGACVDCTAMQNPMPPNTTGRCVGLVEFTCELVCQEGWFSTSGGINDGCECLFVSDYDRPGNGIDENCDGSDGRPDLAWYVSTTGSDLADGTAAAPFRTIQKAIDSAQIAFIKKRVFIAAGTYEENVVFDGPISLIGGFSTDGNWTYSSGNVTTIRAASVVSQRIIAIDGKNATSATWIADLNLDVGPTTQGTDGSDVVGIKCADCTSLGVVRVNIAAGPGGNVTAVPVGASGQAGGAGGAGSYMLTPGAAGTSGCGREGGAGGQGGMTSSGSAGASGKVAGEGGGAGGAGGTSTWAGDGANGQSCTVSGSHMGGAQTVGAGSGGYWLGTSGTTGEDGCSGHGGGGGGGARGYYGSEYPEYGSGGGGGGGGGCAGKGGPGGKAGGASLGIFLDQSDGATISGCTIAVSDAGDGGVGGTGGAGGAGGAGGPWTRGESGYYSGEGGQGGQGTNGGNGGGGAGGISVGIYLSNTSATVSDDNTLTHGAAGVGGSTLGVKNAVDGFSGNVYP